MAAKKGKWAQGDLAKIVVNSTWDGEDCTLARSNKDKRVEHKDRAMQAHIDEK